MIFSFAIMASVAAFYIIEFIRDVIRMNKEYKRIKGKV